MYCPRCGFAMSDFDTQCPRCVRAKQQAPVSMPQERLTSEKGKGITRGVLWAGGIVLVVIFLAIGAAAFREPYRIWQAGVLCTTGLASQTNGDLASAKRDYYKAIDMYPDLCISHGNLGLAILGVASESGLDEQRVQSLMDDATYGNTVALDEADAEFNAALDCVKRRPELLANGAFTNGEGKKWEANTYSAQLHINLAITALVRIAACENAQQAGDAQAWAAVTRQQLTLAKQDDANCSRADWLWRLLNSAGY